MKKFAPMAALLILIAACVKTESPWIKVSTEMTSIGFNGRTMKTPVESNCPWTATCGTEGVMVAPSSYTGSCRVSITVPSSVAKEDRDIKVVFSGEGVSQDAVFSIRQEAAPYIELQKQRDTIPGTGGTIRAVIQANADWVMTTASALTKCTMDPTEGSGTTTVSITVPETTKTRTWTFDATFQLKDYPDNKVTLTVVQLKK